MDRKAGGYRKVSLEPSRLGLKLTDVANCSNKCQRFLLLQILLRDSRGIFQGELSLETRDLVQSKEPAAAEGTRLDRLEMVKVGLTRAQWKSP